MSIVIKMILFESYPTSSVCWIFVSFSSRGSSTCSMIWKGRTAVQTSFVLPFQTSSTSRFSPKEEPVGIGKRFSFLKVPVDVPDFVIGEFNGGCSLIGIFLL